MISSLLLGAGSAILPSVVDTLTGASDARRKALNERQQMLGKLAMDTEREMGANATESGAFKAGMGVLNESFKNQNRTLGNRAAAMGATPEARAGMNEKANNSFNLASLRLLSEAQKRRDLLKRQYAALLGQKAGYDIQDANETLNAQNQWTGGIAGMMPYLLGGVDNTTAPAQKMGGYDVKGAPALPALPGAKSLIEYKPKMGGLG